MADAGKVINLIRLNLFNKVADVFIISQINRKQGCLLYTSDAADDLLCVDLGCLRIIKKKL